MGRQIDRQKRTAGLLSPVALEVYRSSFRLTPGLQG